MVFGIEVPFALFQKPVKMLLFNAVDVIVPVGEASGFTGYCDTGNGNAVICRKV
jgi:hypothetical protein